MIAKVKVNHDFIDIDLHLQPRGTATETMIVVMVPMNRQNIANQRDVLASVICSRVTMAIAYREFTFATATMIVWTTATKTIDINAVSWI